MLNKCILGLYSSDYISHAYSDLAKYKDSYSIEPLHAPLSWIKKCMLSSKLNSIASMPMQKGIASKELESIDMDPLDLDVYICLESVEALSCEYLGFLKKKSPRAKFVLLLLNPVDSSLQKKVNNVAAYYDLLVTCCPEDANAFGWSYYPDCYSRGDISSKREITTDIVFIGVDKGRSELAWEVYEYMRGNGCKCDFLIVDPKNRPRAAEPGFKYKKRMIPYSEYLDRVQKSNCILEITQRDLNYCTLRTMEALAYGKKLITTNKNIVYEPFYNSKRMQTFSKPEDISLDFVKKQNNPPYYFDNPFSATFLMDYIEAALHREEPHPGSAS